MSRVRGFAPWRPQQPTRVLIGNVLAVLAEYAAYLPMTVRQVFYRLVGNFGYEKTELAYERLSEHLNRARRARLVPFSAIRDDGVSRAGGGGWTSVERCWEFHTDRLADLADDFKLDRQLGQPRHVELWVEASGMVPMLANALREYSVRVFSCGGFDSLDFKHDAAQRIAARDRSTVVLHVGDHDPSGVALFEAVSEDVGAMEDELRGSAGRLGATFVRCAVTEEQIGRLALPTAPPKAKDKRGAWQGGGTVQAEALPPDVLIAEVHAAVESWLDLEVWRALLDQEEAGRDELRERVARIGLA